MRHKIQNIYDILYAAFGPQHWWPADTPFEVIIGAILTQNTAWANVEKAITNLKSDKLLTPRALSSCPQKRLARLIKPAGYFNVKAKRLMNFMEFLSGVYANDLSKLFKAPTKSLRKILLNVNGIGGETADSILLYAAHRPVFVVDAYTKRVFSRHGLIKEDAAYEAAQKFFMDGLPRSARLFNEYHALIVRLAKEYCRKSPRCVSCPLRRGGF